MRRRRRNWAVVSLGRSWISLRNRSMGWTRYWSGWARARNSMWILKCGFGAATLAKFCGRCRVFLVHLGGIERVGAEQGMGDGVLFSACGFNVSFKQRGVQQVHNAEAAAGHLVFVGRADAAAGGADLLASRRAFGGQLDHAVIRQNDLGAVGYKQLVVDTHAQFAKTRHFLEESQRVKNHAVADDAFASGTKHAARDELQHELLAADDDRMARVMAACVARYRGKPLAEHV